MHSDLKIREASPRDSRCKKLIDELDRYQLDLYPVESNHLDSIEELEQDNVCFVGAYVDFSGDNFDFWDECGNDFGSEIGDEVGDEVGREARLIGIGAIKFPTNLHRQEVCYGEIKRLYVCADARGKGISYRIMQALEAKALAREVMIIRLETGVYQPEAISVYEKLGYVKTTAFGEYPKDDPLSVFMEKRLIVTAG